VKVKENIKRFLKKI